MGASFKYVGISLTFLEYFDETLTRNTFAHTAPRPAVACNVPARYIQMKRMLEDLDILFVYLSKFGDSLDSVSLSDTRQFLHFLSARRPEPNILVRSIAAVSFLSLKTHLKVSRI